MLLTFLTIVFGSPQAVFASRVAAALCFLCPCPSGDLACEAAHVRVVRAVVKVASEQADPDHAAALLLGTCAHEGACRIEAQIHGPAVTFWHLEVRRAERAALLADDVAAARLALVRARTCGGSMRGYATGSCSGADAAHERSAAELRSAVRSATYALAR